MGHAVHSMGAQPDVDAAPPELRIPDPATMPWPGDELIYRVTGFTDRTTFYNSGHQSVVDLEAVLGVVGRSLSTFSTILDFGSGCGRIALWLEHLAKAGSSLHGVDIDGRAVAWAQDNIPWAEFKVNQPLPPLDYPDGHFDLVFSHSVFTHIDEHYQDRWLDELRRILKPGGYAILSIHGETAFTVFENAVAGRGGDPGVIRRELGARGISFIKDDAFTGGPFPDFYHSTFHAPWYVFEHWGRWFTVAAFLPQRSMAYQDFVLLQRTAVGRRAADAEAVASNGQVVPIARGRPPPRPGVGRRSRRRRRPCTGPGACCTTASTSTRASPRVCWARSAGGWSTSCWGRPGSSAGSPSTSGRSTRPCSPPCGSWTPACPPPPGRVGCRSPSSTAVSGTPSASRASASTGWRTTCGRRSAPGRRRPRPRTESGLPPFLVRVPIVTVPARTMMAGARAAYHVVNLARGPWRDKEVEVSRGGLRWRLDLREGIDLSIYLLGSFEPSVTKSYRRLVSPGDVVLDIGANVGSHTLPLARAVGDSGRVFAFEPTGWAFSKLQANLALNPDLASRVTAEQVMLVGPGESTVPGAIYSSWPLASGTQLHPVHRGRLMSTDDARPVTLDGYLADVGIDRVDFVKLDVDGSEPDVLAGGADTIARRRPGIMMEMAPCLYEGDDGFERIVAFLVDHDYRIEHLRTGRPLPVDADSLRARIPDGSSMNVLCQPA